MRIIALTISALAFVVSHAALADQAGSSGFTFKRMPVPQGGPKITVQIDPEEQARLVAAARAERLAREARAAGREAADAAGGADSVAAAIDGPVVPALNGFEWFWAAVPSEITSPAPTRVSLALAALEGKSDLAEPRLQTLQDIANAHGADILRYTVGTDVSPALVLALISVESSGRSDAESHAGAQGLMQLIPATAERFGVTDSTIPGENIKGGVAYLSWLLEHFDTDPILALAGYNAGEGAVKTHGGVPPFAETRAYVPKVLSAWRVARGLCLTPPQLLTDGCVFAGNRTVTNG
ncbi:MAG: lytic transglycosylase domain-containing protein [Maritimibacter sp.]